VVTAFVALRPGRQPSDDLKRNMQELVKRQLSPYKYPRRIHFVDALPRDAVGKVQPRLLKDLTHAENAEYDSSPDDEP
jgi:2-aminobenzoate-CoA ligase